MKKCTVWFCNRPYYAKGHCHTHWTAQRRYGSPYGRHKEPFERIQSRIDELEYQLKNALELLNIYEDRLETK